MTREEKLDWLYRLKSEIFVLMPKEWIKPMSDALGDVIKALEQEPTTKNNLGVDAISRKQAIEEADKLCLETGYDNEKVIEMLNELPAVTPQEPILDKIRVEIKQLRLHKAQFITSDNKVCIDSQAVLDIIDKYKAES